MNDQPQPQLLNLAEANKTPAVYVNNFMLSQCDGTLVRIVFGDSASPLVTPEARVVLMLPLQMAETLGEMLKDFRSKIAEHEAKQKQLSTVN